MSSPLRTAILAFGIMSIVGVAAPFASYFAHGYHRPRLAREPARHPSRPANDGPASLKVAHRPRGGDPGATRRVAAPPPATPPPPVGAGRSVLGATPELPNQDAPPEANPRACQWHRSETFASGRVWVCDVTRTSNEHPQGTFAPQRRRAALGPAYTAPTRRSRADAED